MGRIAGRMSIKKQAAIAAGATAVVVAAHAGVTLAVRSGVDARLAAMAGPDLTVTRDAVEVDPWSGRITVRGLSLASSDGNSVRASLVRLAGTTALVSPALAAGNVTVENLSIAWNKVTYALPRLDVVGSSVGEADIRDLFNLNATTPLKSRLAAISADSVSAPELRIVSDVPDAKVSMVYRDLRMSGIANGVIRSSAASGGAFASEGKGGETMTGTLGAMTANLIDLPWLIHAYTEPAAPGETEPKTAYGSFSLDSMTGTVQAEGKPVGQFAVGKMTGRDFRIRATKEPWLPFIQQFASKPESERSNLSPTDRAKLVNVLADMMDASQFGGMEATGFSFTGGEAAKKVTFTIGRMAYAGAQVGKPNEVRLENFELKTPDGRARFGTIAHSGWSFRNTLEGLRKTVGQADFDMTSIDPRVFIPEIGTFTLRDLDFDVPDTSAKAKDAGAPNIKFMLKAFELQATEPLNGIPTVLRTSIDRFNMPLPQNARDDNMKNLLALGIKELDLSLGVDMRWQESTSDLTLSQIAFQGVNIGAFSLRGTIGNVSRDIFTGDAMTAQFAAMAATVKDATLTLDNKGIVEKLLETEAKKAKKSPDQLRKELSQGAGMLVPAFLGPSPGSKAVLAALQKFIAKPGRLTVSATSKDPAGLGAADLIMGGGNPQAIVAKVDLTASAD
jgi:hypothetical protein